MIKKTAVLVPAMTVSLYFMAAGPARAGMEGMEGHSMKTHHQHLLMDHGLSMVLQGSNMVMLGQMEMVSALDSISVDHGKKMINNGKKAIEEALSGPAMMKMHGAGHDPKSDSMMKATHDLGESVLKVVDLVEKMDMGSMKGESMMAMHHMHTLINHALSMAAEGANLAMVGQMGMAGDFDPPTVKHGKMMIKNARGLIGEVMEAPVMKEMHGKGKSPDKDPMMGHTHKMTEISYKIIGQLEKMLEGK